MIFKFLRHKDHLLALTVVVPWELFTRRSGEDLVRQVRQAFEEAEETQAVPLRDDDEVWIEFKIREKGGVFNASSK